MKEQEQHSKSQEQKSHLNKRFKIILGIIAAVLLLLIVVLLLQGTDRKQQNLLSNPAVSQPQATVNPSGTVNRNFNPLIDNREVERVENSLRKKMEGAGITISPKPEYKFQYKLDPALQNKGSFRFVEPVLAANTCNILSAPATLPIYSLKDHLTVNDAKDVALTFDIEDDPKGSVPSLDGSSFDYFFSDAVVSQFLQVSEPSGVSYWHRVVDATGASSGQSPQTIAQTELEKHKISDRAVLKSTKTDPASGLQSFITKKTMTTWS